MAHNNKVERLWLNTDVLYEDWFTIADIERNQEAKSLLNNINERTLRRLVNFGRKSPACKVPVKLEVAFGSSGQLCSSLQACRRFYERLNGFLDPLEETPSSGSEL